MRPIVLRFGAIGDMVLLTSALSMLHRRWATPIDVAVRNAAAKEVLKGLPEVGEVKVIGSRRAPYSLAPGQWRFVRWLRERGPGPAWVVDSVGSVSRLLERGGIDLSLQVRQLDHPWPAEQLVHHHDWLLHLATLDPPGVEPRPSAGGPPPRPHLVIDPAEATVSQRWLENRGLASAPVVVVQSQSRRRSKGRWPAERWAGLLRAIMERLPSAHAVFTGTSREAGAIRRVVRAIGHPRVHSVAGELSLRPLIALLDRAHSCVSLDSGPAHIAAAVGCPVTVVVGPAHPGLYRPVGLSGRVGVVGGMPPEDWPSDPAVFSQTHRVESVDPAVVFKTWETVCERSGRWKSA